MATAPATLTRTTTANSRARPRAGVRARRGRAARARARGDDDDDDDDDDDGDASTRANEGARAGGSGRGMAYVDDGGVAPTLAEYERALATAVREERYEDAATIRDVMRSISDDALRAVTEANERFYRAFRLANRDAMDAVWTDGSHAQCAHPGQSVACGKRDVMASWDIIFAGVPESQGIDVTCVDVRAHAGEGWGVVTCVEKIGVGARLTAVNVFERSEDGVWRVVVHQAHAVRAIG